MQTSTSLQLHGAPSLLSAAGASSSRLQPSADSAVAGFLQRTLEHIRDEDENGDDPLRAGKETSDGDGVVLMRRLPASLPPSGSSSSRYSPLKKLTQPFIRALEKLQPGLGGWFRCLDREQQRAIFGLMPTAVTAGQMFDSWLKVDAHFRAMMFAGCIKNQGAVPARPQSDSVPTVTVTGDAADDDDDSDGNDESCHCADSASSAPPTNLPLLSNLLATIADLPNLSPGPSATAAAVAAMSAVEHIARHAELSSARVLLERFIEQLALLHAQVCKTKPCDRASTAPRLWKKQGTKLRHGLFLLHLATSLPCWLGISELLMEEHQVVVKHEDIMSLGRLWARLCRLLHTNMLAFGSPPACSWPCAVDQGAAHAHPARSFFAKLPGLLNKLNKSV